METEYIFLIVAFLLFQIQIFKMLYDQGYHWKDCLRIMLTITFGSILIAAVVV